MWYRAWLALLMLPVLAQTFGDPTATGRQLTAATLEVDLSVVAEGAEAVVAHLIDPGGEQRTVPMVSRSGSRFGIIVEVPRIDYVVVFEALGAGVSSQSHPQRLSELGLDPGLLGILPFTPTTVPEPNPARQWGWVALALGALALALLAWWALPEAKKPEVSAAEDQAEG
jgi:hypothetical protein